ncbi:MAG TPA: hypothetical protein DCZ12_18610 [Gammaproteobacteria bacterium]|nr:hypothetical protein [Gammaproteobacteria bacterium]
MNNKHPDQAPWHDPQGNLISCTEKVKVLTENHREMREMLQDCFEDALLMGCDEEQFRQILKGLIDELENPYHDLD